jgi:hypothetical protein
MRIFFCFNILIVNCILLGQNIKCTEWQKIIPSGNFPDGVECRRANNNLDIVEFKGKYYVAFRTAPTHFASKKTALYVLSTYDFNSWGLEQKVFLQTDLREPRFFKNNDTLFFMFFKGGTKLLHFQPNGIFLLTFYDNKWSPIKAVDNIPLGYVPWRVKPYKGIFLLSAYDGASEYDKEKSCAARLFTSNDGIHWQPLSTNPQILHPRATAENEFVFDSIGNIWGISRLEYDGSYIFRGDKDSIYKWKLWYSPYKFDSPMLFNHEDNLFLLSRRNLDGDGIYYRKPEKYNRNLIRYSLTKKTTSLFQIDTTIKNLVHILDFNSTGDCAFPGIIKTSDSTYIMLNYSSNINKRNKSWIAGQLGKTYIYKSIITFSNSDPSYEKKIVYPFTIVNE